jgi:hypothetical protein
MLLSVALTTFPFIASQQKYTIGAAGNFVAPRPVWIPCAALLLPAGPGGPIKMLSASEWSQLPDRQSTSYQVRYGFYDRAFATGNLYFSPVPLAGSVELTTFSALPPFADATTALTMPGPGYLDLYIFGTAIRMAAQMEVPIPDSVATGWQSSLERVRIQNAKIYGTLPPEVAAAIGGK